LVEKSLEIGLGLLENSLSRFIYFYFFYAEKVAKSLTPSGWHFFLFAGGGQRWKAAAFECGWNRQLHGVANICEGELILCFANIQIYCNFFK
jgi:hypothetical protein